VRQLALLSDRRYERVLEIGCGAGAFSTLLGGISDKLLGIDVSQEAIARAGTAAEAPDIEFRVENVVGFDVRQGGPWDLIVFSETIYYLGSLPVLRCGLLSCGTARGKVARWATPAGQYLWGG